MEKISNTVRNFHGIQFEISTNVRAQWKSNKATVNDHIDKDLFSSQEFVHESCAMNKIFEYLRLPTRTLFN